MTDSSRPVLVFDGDCGFCRRSVGWLRARTADRVDYRPYQEVHAAYPQIGVESFASAVHLIEPDGAISHGAEAIARALRRAPGWGLLAAAYRIPGVAPIAAAAYRFVAQRRVGFSRLARWTSGASLEPLSFQNSRRLFFALLGVVFLSAFVSCWVQVAGLVGSDGLLPIAELLERARNTYGEAAYRSFPTLSWLDSSDAFLFGQCAAGTAASLLLILGRAPRLLTAILWALYLSLVVAGQDFFAFQWDGLLLETALLAVLFAPRGLRPRWDVEPSTWSMFLMRWLLLRLMLLSGLVKLGSGDAAWSGLRALDTHFFTQPLPIGTSYFAHHAPRWIHETATIGMFVVELGLPLLIFLPRRLRLLSAVGFAALQVGIIATGNYGFFNVLSLALCVPLVDDRCWRAFVPGFLRDRLLPLRPAVFAPASRWRSATAWAFGGVLFVAATTAAVDSLARGRFVPAPAQSAWRQVQALRSTNAYGLFAVMTTRRPEIVFEGSDDARDWHEYEFAWKPGSIDRAPRIAGLHMPRLDWQLWFEALARRRGAPPSAWFERLQERLLRGSTAVRALLTTGVYDDDAPRYVRAVLYDYTFASWRDHKRRGHWWKRRRIKSLGARTLVH